MQRELSVPLPHEWQGTASLAPFFLSSYWALQSNAGLMRCSVLLPRSYRCDCSDTGFEGDHCEVDILECASEPCLNSATCVEGIKEYSCACWPGGSDV